MNRKHDHASRSPRRSALRKSLDVERSAPRPVFSLVLLGLAALLLWAFTALNAGAFDYLEIPEHCQVIDDLNPFPDISGWNLVEEKDMGVMEDSSIRMCTRKTFIEEQSNRRLYVVYFKGKPELYWYNMPEMEKEKSGVAEMLGNKESTDPTKAGDYREQSKQNFDMGFGFLKF